eukprot:GHVQ01033932.1.p1 GENE.GHVQ01033932.1~~GHVQ01033932.1.p1  ORF type:complete len:136 (+),score=6.47 GHVQ01033932.1:319-726(+)
MSAITTTIIEQGTSPVWDQASSTLISRLMTASALASACRSFGLKSELECRTYRTLHDTCWLFAADNWLESSVPYCSIPPASGAEPGSATIYHRTWHCMKMTSCMTAYLAHEENITFLPKSPRRGPVLHELSNPAI